MTIAIPVWLVWALGIAGGVIGLLIIACVIVFALVGAACSRAIGGGLKW